ncbi:MAG: DUF4062 domain-containing protein [Deltaproteobacteria bacterium]|nr:DUF4062 domain-containing protein [Deltaproteobacteria bacterium]
MAKPTVFISSTFYDLRNIRDDLAKFIRELGYNPTRYETSGIPYLMNVPLEESAYQEVANCDILICIIGGQYGTKSATREGSITQNELKEALEGSIPIYVFVEQNVLSEFETYKRNKKKGTSVEYHYADNVEIYKFIEKIYALPLNNLINSFQTSADITSYLRDQWAGLFQRFLQKGTRQAEMTVLNEMKSMSSTLEQLVKLLTDECRDKDIAIQNILLANHPVFRQFATLTDTNYRVFFTNMEELNDWLKVRKYRVNEDLEKESVAEWISESYGNYIVLKEEIFDDSGKLKPYSDDEWKEEWLKKVPFSTEEGKISF